MNGKRGVVTDFHPMGGPTGNRANWRYTVKLDDGEVYRLKPGTVKAEKAEGGAGKGKGKKGRAARK